MLLNAVQSHGFEPQQHTRQRPGSKAAGKLFATCWFRHLAWYTPVSDMVGTTLPPFILFLAPTQQTLYKAERASGHLAERTCLWEAKTADLW